MNLYVWEDCVNRDYTAGDLCIAANSLAVARRKMKKWGEDNAIRLDDTLDHMLQREPDRVLTGYGTVWASSGGG